MKTFQEKFIEKGGKLTSLEGFKGSTIQPEKYSAVIWIGNWCIQLKDKTFTEEQIKNMREFFGWEVENLCESQSET